MHAYEMHAYETHTYEMQAYEMYAYRYTPMRYTPMRYTPMRYTPMRYTPMRYTPRRRTLMGCMPMRSTMRGKLVLSLSFPMSRRTRRATRARAGTVSKGCVPFSLMKM